MSNAVGDAWTDDKDHPIPFVNHLDVFAKWEDGKRWLSIVVANPLDGSEYSQKRLLNKIQNYIAYLGTDEYVAENGNPSSELVSIVVKIHKESSPLIFELLKKCESWVKSGSASLVVEQF